MSEARLISPLLDGFAVGGAMSERNGVSCYPAMHQDSDERYIVKTISVPSSPVQLEALLLTGAYQDAEAARNYFREVAEDIGREAEILNRLASQRGFLPFYGHQIVPMENDVGYEVYLVSSYGQTLERHLSRAPLTHLSAVNMGIDLCAALAVCREAGWLYVNLKPSNIFIPGEQEFYLGDLGFVSLDSLLYASLPDRCRSRYTAPEISDAFSQLNTTMDTYALGMVLYQVYNNGQLPSAQDIGALPAPICADEQMAQIILKACAPDPKDRYQSPAEMGHDLIAYMQRNEVNNVPILPAADEPGIEEAAEPEAAAEPVDCQPAGETAEPVSDDEICEEASDDEISDEVPDAETSEDVSDGETPEEAPAEQGAEIPSETAPADDETSTAEDIPAAEEPAAVEAVQYESVEADIPAEDTTSTGEDAPVEEAPEEDWIDRMDAILSEDQPGDAADPAEDDISLRDLLAQDENAPAEVSTDELSDETADMLLLAQELIEHEAPQPAVAPEPIDVPMPEPIVLTEDTPEAEEASGETPAAQPEEAATEEMLLPDSPAEAEPAEESTEAAYKSPIWKKLMIAVLVLLLLAAAAFGLHYGYNHYYLQTIDAFTVEGSVQSVTVYVDTDLDESLLTVICKDTSGNSVPGSLENGQVTFTDLAPGTQYTLSLEVSGYHKLVGDVSAKVYYTPPQTQLTGLSAVIGSEDGSVIISFGVEGADSEQWTLTYTAEGEQAQSLSFPGHTVSVTGLTVGKTYTFTLTCDDDVNLVGENSIEYTASSLIFAQNISVTGYQDGTITATWSAPEGVSVSGWVARCYNEDGFDQKLDVTEPSATFTDVEPSAGYTIEITAAGMVQSKLVYVTATPITITDLTGTVSGNSIKISWEYEGIDPSDDWLVVYTVDNGGAQNVIQTSSQSASINLVAPGSTYHISIQCADSTSVFCDAISIKVPAVTKAFSGYRQSASTIAVTSYKAPSKNSWNRGDLGSATTTFTSGSSMALVYRTKTVYEVTYDDIFSLFVIRDSDGNLVSISSRTRTWEAMWEGGYCTEEIAQLPTEAGSYSLEIYIAGGLLNVLNFDIQ